MRAGAKMSEGRGPRAKSWQPPHMILVTSAFGSAFSVGRNSCTTSSAALSDAESAGPPLASAAYLQRISRATWVRAAASMRLRTRPSLTRALDDDGLARRAATLSNEMLQPGIVGIAKACWRPAAAGGCDACAG